MRKGSSGDYKKNVIKIMWILTIRAAQKFQSNSSKRELMAATQSRRNKEYDRIVDICVGEIPEITDRIV